MPIPLGSRRRERRDTRPLSIKLGVQTLYYKGSVTSTSTRTSTKSGLSSSTDWSLLEKCWDELHTRERVVKYYIKRRCQRRHYISAEEAYLYKRLQESSGYRLPYSVLAKLGHGKYFTSGGPFLKVMYDRRNRFKIGGYGRYVNDKIDPYKAQYVGGFIPTTFGPNCPSALDLYNGYVSSIAVPESLGEGLEALGAKAWNSARPKTKRVDLGTFVGELRELPEMLRTSAKGFHDLWRTISGKRNLSLKDAPKEIANHFLNHAFGWAPFVDDVLKMNDTLQNLDLYLHQLMRDNKKWVKRRRRVEEVSDVTLFSAHAGTSAAVEPAGLHEWMYDKQNGLYGKTNFWTAKKLETWFVGSFKYYIPHPPDNPDTRNYNRVMGALQLFGVGINPSVIWNLTPWSWLGDWFGNMGDVIDNITAQNSDHLTARYAYIMRHDVTEYVNDSTIYLHGAGKHGVRCVWTTSLDTKARVEAQPFGFGLTGGGINSPYRMAILAALGLTQSGDRVRRTM